MWLFDALFDFVAVLDVLAESGHSGVEDVTQAVPPEVLLRQDPVHLPKGVVLVQPQSPQVSNTTHVILEVVQGTIEVLFVAAQVIENPQSEGSVLGDEVEDALPEYFGDVLALTDLGLQVVIGLLIIWRVLILSLELLLLFDLRNLQFLSGCSNAFRVFLILS